jgi:hypothetical protein
MPACALLRKLEKDIEADLDWRQAELAVLREMLILSAEFETRKRVLFRTGWDLLYAHYEGFSKFCLELYIEYLGNACGPLHSPGRRSRQCKACPFRVSF